jgi:uncharacterized protein
MGINPRDRRYGSNQKRLFEMFKVNLSSFEDRGEFDFELKNKEISFEGLSFEDGLSISLILTKDGSDTVIAEGRIVGTLLTQCSRCLDDVKLQVDSDFVTIFKDKKAITQDDLDNDVRPYANNSIDLTDYLRETMILEVPLKPLCREDCKGICPICGKNNNKETCSCMANLKQEETYKPFKGLDIH